MNNWNRIEEFYNSVYENGLPKIVLCGINPGRNGAGKTGILFLDFTSLSKIMNGVNRSDSERSAQFFYDIVEEIGVGTFYNSFYVTNISWVGYTKGGKNLNCYDLPPLVKRFVLDMFKYEMAVVSPTTIIPLSSRVQDTLKGLFDDVTIDTNLKLPDPNYCAFPKNYESCKAMYLEVLSKYIKT